MQSFIYKYILTAGSFRAKVYATCDSEARTLAKSQCGDKDWITKMRIRLNKDQLWQLYKEGKLNHLVKISGTI